MDDFLMAFAILVNSHIAFLSSLFSWVSQDKVNKEQKLQSKKSNKLQDLKKSENDILISLLLLEFVIYTLIAFGFGLFIYKLNFAWYINVAFVLGGILLLIILRSIISGIAAYFADKLIMKNLRAIEFYLLIGKPFFKIYNFLFTKIIGKDLDKTSRDDLSAMFETAYSEGSIETDEYMILKNIMNFNEVLVSDVMTPRTVIFACSSEKLVSEVIGQPELKMYSRIPIFEGDSLDDEVIGYVMSKDILLAALGGEGKKKLKEFKREIYSIPENVELDKALEQFLKRRQHLALVVDEYGDVGGLITMEDVLETILGVEIVDEADKIVDLREWAKLRRDKRIESLNK